MTRVLWTVHVVAPVEESDPQVLALMEGEEPIESRTELRGLLDFLSAKGQSATATVRVLRGVAPKDEESLAAANDS